MIMLSCQPSVLELFVMVCQANNASRVSPKGRGLDQRFNDVAELTVLLPVAFWGQVKAERLSVGI